MTHQASKAARIVIAAAWVFYLALLMPVRFPFSSRFEFLFVLLGAVGLIVLIAAAANWARLRAIAYAGVVITLALYAAYWSSIASAVLSHNPSYGAADLLSRYSANVSALVDRQLTAGSAWGAARLVFFDVVAPFLQLAVGIWLLITGRSNTGGALQSNPTVDPDARKSGARGSP